MHECLDTHVQVFYPWFWPFRESLVTWKCGWDTLRNWQFKCGLEPDSEQVSLSGSVKVSEWHVLLNITVICLNWTGYLRTEVYQHEMAKMGLCWYSQAGFCVRSWKKLVLEEEPIPFSLCLRDVSVLPGLSTDLSWPSPIPETKKEKERLVWMQTAKTTLLPKHPPPNCWFFWINYFTFIKVNDQLGHNLVYIGIWSLCK